MAEDLPSSPAFSATPWHPLADEIPQAAPPPAAWGPWASVGWTVLAVALMLGTQLATVVVYAVARVLADPKFKPATLVPDGRLVAVSILISVPLVLGLVGLLIAVRGWRVGGYLALHPAPARAAVLATSGLIILLAASDGLTVFLGRPIVPPVMAGTVLTAPLWLISLAVVVGAPIVEEVLFRGFLYRGLAQSRLGPGVAIGITALGWAALHVQYDLYGIATIYLMGLYLGLVRHYAGSTRLTIFLHGIANTVATAEAVWLAG